MPSTMHSFESNSSNVPAFLVKLWKLVEDPTCNDLIAWSEHGTSFIIRDQTRFSKDLLPQYFKHNNMASFIRQLNMYGFRKVMNYEKSGLRNENDEMEFMHTFFCKDQGSLLEFIKRKIPNTKVSEPPVKSNAKDILTDLSSIREKQENMDNMLLKMKKENELLWRELTSMRQKHKAQEQIIQKVIQFLVSIVQQSNQNLGVKRKIPRMLHDSPSSKRNSEVACAIDVLRNKTPNFITVDQDKLVSPLGPVIHEVTEFEQDESPISPLIKSPEDRSTDIVKVPESSELQANECFINSNLNSPINTSENMEPLSILEPLQSNAPILSSADCILEESVLGIPLDYLPNPEENVITIPQEASNNVISLPDTSTELSYSINTPNMVVYTSTNSEFDDSMSESLMTPNIPTIHIKDVCPSPAKSKSEKLDETVHEKVKSNVDSEHNYQLAVSDSSNMVKSSAVTKNTLSNHIINVQEELDWLQNQINSHAWNVDADKLLTLFSTDDVANNEAIAGEIAAQTNIKTESNDIAGNELVQFTPLLDLDIGSSQLFECLDQDTSQALMNLDTNDKNTNNQKNDELVDVLSSANQETASEAAEFLLNNKSSPKNKSSRRPKSQKLQKAKRRKII